MLDIVHIVLPDSIRGDIGHATSTCRTLTGLLGVSGVRVLGFSASGLRLQRFEGIRYCESPAVDCMQGALKLRRWGSMMLA